MRGKFIVFEGIDGSGKTVQSLMLKEHLRNKGLNVSRVIDPGTTDLGEYIRHLVKTKPMHNMSSLMLFMTARYELYHNVIKPALEAGEWVISDRFYYSTYVYQGIYQGLSKEYEILKSMMFRDVRPDYVFYLDISPELSMQRIDNRQDNSVKDNYDNIKLDMKEKMREGYLGLLHKENNFIYIPGGLSEFAVYQNVKQFIKMIENDIDPEDFKQVRRMLLTW